MSAAQRRERHRRKKLAALLITCVITATEVVTLRAFHSGDELLLSWAVAGEPPAVTAGPAPTAAPLSAATPAPTPARTSAPAPSPEPAAAITEEPEAGWSPRHYVQPDSLGADLRLPEGSDPGSLKSWYRAILNRIVDKYGVCDSEYGGQGLAYAELIDFDGDGLQELYLYYINDDRSMVDDPGYTGKVLHEEVWRGGDCLFRRSHWDTSSTDSEHIDSDGRFLLWEGGKTILCSTPAYAFVGRQSYASDEITLGANGVEEALLLTVHFLENNPAGAPQAELLAAYGLNEHETMNDGSFSLAFTHGTRMRNGEEETKYDYKDCRALYTLFRTLDYSVASEISYIYNEASSDSFVWEVMARRSQIAEQGRRLIFCDDYQNYTESGVQPFHWVLKDCGALFDRLV